MSEEQERFERELAAWGRQAPHTSPGLASQRVVHRLPARPGAWPRWQLAAAVVLLVGVMLAVWRATPSGPPSGYGEVDAWLPEVNESTVVWIVDPETTVLFALRSDGDEKGGA